MRAKQTIARFALNLENPIFFFGNVDFALLPKFPLSAWNHSITIYLWWLYSKLEQWLLSSRSTIVSETHWYTIASVLLTDMWNLWVTGGSNGLGLFFYCRQQFVKLNQNRQRTVNKDYRIVFFRLTRMSENMYCCIVGLWPCVFAPL